MKNKQSYKWDNISLGTCYYPEHWDETLWRSDLKRMKENGIFTVRIAEFAWSKIEKQEGEFDFNFFDGFLDLAEEEGIKVIFGTPTATPPAWLTEKYPEVLNCKKSGEKYYHGMRRQCNYNSEVYRKLSARIVENIAEHYGKRPCIVGWQIDNELNWELDVFYTESDTRAFREFLKTKYKTLDALNEAWGTVFWNQTYTSWEEIYVPRDAVFNGVNPHLELDYIRFVSDSAIRFCRMQSEIIKKYKKPEDFVTTNGLFGNLDNHTLTNDCLDVFTYDSYPNMAYQLESYPRNSKTLNDRKWSRNLSEIRSISPHFGIMEQQSGANGWNSSMETTAPKPGQIHLWAMQSIAHGADFVNFFRWRTATFGTEMYWHGILDQDNRDNRKLRELNRIWKMTESISEVTGAEYKAAFGLVKDYSNIWDSQIDVWHGRLEKASEIEVFVASQMNHTPMDFVYLLEDTAVEELIKYPVLIYPHLYIINEKKVKLLEEYVRNGGCLILGAQTGKKNEDGKCVMLPIPGLMASLTQTSVEESTFIGKQDEPVTMDWDKLEIETGIFNDVLTTVGPDTKVLARYKKSYYEGSPALVETVLGKGKVLHFGGTFTRNNVKTLLEYAGILAPFSDLIQLPEECEIAVREKEERTYIFVLNYSDRPQDIVLCSTMTDMSSSEVSKGKVILKPYETKVYKTMLL